MAQKWFLRNIFNNWRLRIIFLLLPPSILLLLYFQSYIFYQISFPNYGNLDKISPTFINDSVLIRFGDRENLVRFGIWPKKSSSMLTILVTSTPNDVGHRNFIRSTWGKLLPKNYSLIFVLGNYTSTNKKLLKESEIYDDLLIADFIDSYENLTLKTMASFCWCLKFCHSEFLLKTDDDMIISVQNLMKIVIDNREKRNSIFGYVNNYVLPKRDTKSKWFTSPVAYPFKYYPSYCSGAAYLVTLDAVEKLLSVSYRHNYVPVEDVYLTGILAQDAQVQRWDADGDPYASITPCNSKDQIAFHSANKTLSNLRFLWLHYLNQIDQSCTLYILQYCCIIFSIIAVALSLLFMILRSFRVC